MHGKRVSDHAEILKLLRQENNVLAVLNKRAWTGKGIYDGLAVVQINPKLDISQSYFDVATMINANNFEKIEEIENDKK